MEDKNIKSSVLTTLGKNVKQIRLLKGLSQENLASELQKSINFVSLLENGKTGLSVQTIIDICNALEIDANTLFSGIINSQEKEDSFIINSFNLFNEKDKEIITNLTNYITNPLLSRSLTISLTSV